MVNSYKKACSLLCVFGGKNIYQLNNLQKVGLKGSSQMKKALEYLVNNDHIYKDGIYSFSDVIFKKSKIRNPSGPEAKI